MYEKGHGVTQDYAQALSWYRKAADQGNAAAQRAVKTAEAAEQKRIAQAKVEAERRAIDHSGRVWRIKIAAPFFIVAVLVVGVVYLVERPQQAGYEPAAVDMGQQVGPTPTTNSETGSLTHPAETPAVPHSAAGSSDALSNVSRITSISSLPTCGGDDTANYNGPRLPLAPSGCSYVVCVPALRRWLRLSSKGQPVANEANKGLVRLLCGPD
jgi:hypothetical protein